MWNSDTKTVDDKELNSKIAKNEMKKAMPFVQGLKKRLASGEPAEAVLDRKLVFDEKALLLKMVPGLIRMTGLSAVDVVAVQPGGKTGANVTDGSEAKLQQVAEVAVPGTPSFYFENV
jgi:leucyl-tRNA synthetase